MVLAGALVLAGCGNGVACGAGVVDAYPGTGEADGAVWLTVWAQLMVLLWSMVSAWVTVLVSLGRRGGGGRLLPLLAKVA